MTRRPWPGREEPINGEMLFQLDARWRKMTDEQRAKWEAKARLATIVGNRTSAQAEYMADFLRRKLKQKGRES